MSIENDPPRLLAGTASLDSSGGGPRLLRDALDAARSELPGPERLAALHEKLAAATAAVGAAGTGGAAGASSVVAKSALWVKLALVAAGASAIAGSAALATSPTKVPAAVPTSVHTASIVTTVTANAATGAASSESSSALPPATPVTPGGPAATRPAKAQTSDLTEETRLLTEAQRALASNPAEALRLCETHRKTFAAGLLSQERDAVIVEALVKQGRRSEAKRAGAAFARSYPGSSHLRRISDLVGDSSD